MRYSKRFATIVIDKVEGSSKKQEILVAIFESTMRSLGKTLARSAQFDLKDNGIARRRNAAEYQLTMSKRTIDGTTFWDGTFSNESAQLLVTGHFEPVGGENL